MTVLLLIFWYVVPPFSPLSSSHWLRTVPWRSFLPMCCTARPKENYLIFHSGNDPQIHDMLEISISNIWGTQIQLHLPQFHADHVLGHAASLSRKWYRIHPHKGQHRKFRNRNPGLSEPSLSECFLKRSCRTFWLQFFPISAPWSKKVPAGHSYRSSGISSWTRHAVPSGKLFSAIMPSANL